MMPKRKKKFKGDTAALVQTFSKNLLGLKFMQRATKVVEKDPLDEYESGSSEEDEADERKNEKDISIQLDTSSIQKLKAKKKCIINPSYQFCEKLKFGRLSFKGMNTDIEDMMSNKSALDTSWSNTSLEPGQGGGGTSGSSGQKRPAEDYWDEEED